MLNLHLTRSHDSSYHILCVGSHADDIEIGCGGTILSLLETHPNLMFHWVVFSSSPERAHEARQSAAVFLKQARSSRIVIHDFRDGFFPYVGAEIKTCFEQLKQEVFPDIIFTHQRNDLHQDHRLISELTWNTFRTHLILEYEVPKYDGDFGVPNTFVHLDESICRTKIQYILENFRSQNGRSWFGEETFLAILRLRGMESNAPSKFAEAFYCRKLVVGLGDGTVGHPAARSASIVKNHVGSKVDR